MIRLGQITGQNQVICYEGSVLDKALLAQIFTEHDISAVIHFAALKAVGESVEQPLAYFSTNVTGLLCLLEEMKSAGITRLVFSSSATVYGEPEEVPIAETAPLQFTSPYGFTKVASEQILTQAAAADPWAFGVLRYFNPAGAHPSGLIGEDPSDIPNNLMPYIAKVASGALPHLNVFGNDYDTRDGTGERDYIHVCDLARGHVLSVQKLLSTDEGHVVNLGTGQAYSVLEMNTAYGKAAGQTCPMSSPPAAQATCQPVWPMCAKRKRFWALRLTSVWMICAEARGIGSKHKPAARRPWAAERPQGSKCLGDPAYL